MSPREGVGDARDHIWSRARTRSEYPLVCRVFGHKKHKRTISDPLPHREKIYWTECAREGCFWYES